MSIVDKIKKNIFELLFPAFCVGCGVEGVLLCGSCRNSLRALPPSCFVCKKWVFAGPLTPAGRTCPPCRGKSQIYAFFSPFSYDDSVVRELIHGLKYRFATSLAPVLGRVFLEAFSHMKISVPSDALILPIPLSPDRGRVRGFNQSEIIARHLGDFFGLSVVCDALVKDKKTTPQMELSRENRLLNMKGVFAVRNRIKVENKIAVLVDDVKTTGSTLEEAARVLKEAGAKEVWAVTVAH